MVFVVEKRTTKYLPTKRLVVAWGVVYSDHENFSRNSLNFDFHENFAPRKIPAIRYLTLFCRQAGELYHPNQSLKPPLPIQSIHIYSIANIVL